jgi:hypothetical protein
MTTKITRRQFISGVAVAGVALAAGGWWVFRDGEEDPSEYIVKVLVEQLNYLKLDEAGVRQFAKDFQEHFPYNPVGADSYFISQFLLSSDFFVHDADMSRTIKYVEYYDPYETPCANPFAQF